jgi:hypothetical protein
MMGFLINCPGLRLDGSPSGGAGLAGLADDGVGVLVLVLDCLDASFGTTGFAVLAQ